ncbi:acyl-CoA dehydrogenase family protein [Actinomadura livida]|uniref:Acyl-CoA dehydrogenase family protein n=1 Tax=Actinomadura livida TaxID=79909 RepID=A0A7W7MZP7_9ACTN|nr:MULTISPECIES: acyl-CoA dehydrogenase [Actinomadura]MBB4776075.1 alkylation response protein AidB-like acyl-CoA dehydrogenase [Actinomadura catellatispora]GGU15678.1 acyl-CoA dehydrogenase [Actinomadura livida]
MEIAFTPEQEELRAVLRGFLAEHADRRRLLDSGSPHDAELWRRMATGIAVQGLAVPEEYGGSGFGAAEMCVVFEELGGALAAGALLATAGLAVPALLACGDEEIKAEHLPGIADGSTIATLALVEADGSWDAEAARTTAKEGADGFAIDGTKYFVLDGAAADLILVTADTGAGTALFAVSGTAPGLTRRAHEAVDPTREMARLDFASVPARLVSRDPAVTGTALDHARIALAAEQAGGARWCLDAAVGYAKTRHQFDRPIGEFQAIKHRCADMMVAVEAARSAAYAAALTPHPDPAGLAVAAASAQICCSRAYTEVAAGAVQIHGGIGFTWEHDVHLYYKRAKTDEVLFGTPDWHRDRLARLSGITEEGTDGH